MKVYTTDKISLGGHSLDVAWVEGLSSTNVNLGVTAHGWGNHADAGYLTTYTNTDTNTQLSDAQIAAMGYIKTYTDTNTQLSDAQVGEMGYIKTYIDTNTHRGIDDTPVNGATAVSISSNWAFDNVKTAVPAGALFTDTNTTYDLTGYISKGSTITPGASWTTATKFKSSGDIGQGAGNHSLQILSDINNDAFMAFHISSDYAIHFGLDNTSNRLYTGGWSDGTGTKYQLYDSRDFSVANVLEAHGWGNHADEGYLTSYTDTDTNTQLSQAQVGAYAVDEGFIKEYTDTDTQLTDAQIAEMGYIKTYTDTNTTYGNTDFVDLTSAQTVGGIKTFTSDMVIKNGDPTLGFADTDANNDDFYIHVNSNNFYVLADRDDSGLNNGISGWDGSHPLQLESDTNKAYTFGNEIYHTGNLPTIPSGNSTIDWTTDQGGTNIHSGNYTNTDTNTQLTTAQIAAMGYIKENEDRRHKVLRFTGEGSNSNNSVINYGIYQEGGAWTHPYPDLVIGMHTGIKIGGAQGYNGTRFYSDAPGRTGAVELMSVGNGDGDVRVTNVAHAGNSFRAPYFYSPGDTTYFLDPASSSVLFSVSAQHFYGNLTGNASSATIAAAYLPLSGGTLTGDITVGSGKTSSNIYMADSDGTARRIHTNSNRIGFLTSGNGWGSYCTNNGDWTTDMISYAGASMRAPVFYDSNDTNYYLNPASTSNLNIVQAVQFQGSLAGTASNANTLDSFSSESFLRSDGDDTVNGGVTYTWTRTDTAGIVFVNNTYNTQLAMGGWTTANSSNVSRIRTSSGNLHIDSASNGNTYLNWYSGGDVKTNSILQSDASLRAPIFYDSNNTSYYVHADSTTQLNHLSVNSTFKSRNFTAGSLGYQIENRNADGATFRFDGDTFIFHGGGGVGNVFEMNQNGDLTARTSLQAPIFYDSNNTGYYVDPASTSSLNELTVNGTIAGNISGNANTLDNIDSGSFLRSDATDYQNNTIYQRGYLVNETGYRNRGVYGNYSSTKTNHIWSMGTAYKNHASGTNFGNLYGLAYKHTNNTTGGTMAGGHQMVWCSNGTGRSAMGDNIWTSGNVKAPLYYDSNNTAYYLNPDSTSNLNVLTLAGTATASNFILSSDERKKTKIKDLTRNNINTNWKSFEMKNDEGEYRTGVIAQELEETHPEFVNTDSEGFKSVKYIDLLIAKIAELEARLEKAGI